MRELLLMKLSFEELGDFLGLEHKHRSVMSTMWETNNNGDLILAEFPIPRMIKNPKHILTTYNWFHSWINVKSVCMKLINSDHKKGGILQIFLQGWISKGKYG